MISPNHLDAPHSAPAKPRRPAFTLTPALRAPRRLRGVSDSAFNNVYHDTEENMSDYRRLNVANRFPEPTTEELVAWLRDAIESFADGLRQAPWEIHCAATIIKKLEGDAGCENVTIPIRGDDMAAFREGHHKCGLFESPEGLIQLAVEIGLEHLRRINFDVGAALREDVQHRIGGAA